MALAVATVAMAVFAFLFQLLDVLRVTGGLLATARTAQRILFDPLLGDDDKEPLVQQASRDMFAAIGRVAWRLAVCLAAATAIVLVADALQLTRAAEVWGWLLSWQLLCAAGVALGVIWWTRR